MNLKGIGSKNLSELEKIHRHLITTNPTKAGYVAHHIRVKREALKDDS